MGCVEELLAGDPRAIARSISLVERGGAEAEELVDALFPHTGRALLLGVTGSPGSGKSSLVDRLISRERAAGRRVGVIAVDPTSPFTGGAVLGDRLRMQGHAADPGVFIRSMASRGSLGGVAAATGDAVRVLDAAGFQTILIETVGVGQTEIRVVELSDLVLLVLMPGAGDEIQALKAGVMEIGDLFVINKRDLPGAERLRAEVEYILSLKDPEPGKRPQPIVMVSAVRGEGIEELGQAVEGCVRDLERSGALAVRRRRRLALELQGILTRKIHALMDVQIEISRQLPEWVERLHRRESRPYALVQEQIERFLEEARG